SARAFAGPLVNCLMSGGTSDGLGMSARAQGLNTATRTPAARYRQACMEAIASPEMRRSDRARAASIRLNAGRERKVPLQSPRAQGARGFWNKSQRSISPMTMSMEPTMAGTSAMRQPRQMSFVTLRLQKLDDRARTRNGT